MKKIVAVLFAIFAVTACKKETSINHKLTTKTDCFPTKEKMDNVVTTEKLGSLQEISAEKISENLKPQKNDTLYITNFFATWCGPCMREIPEFKAKMDELKGKPVKFTFVSLDEKTEWNEAVKNFAEENNLTKNVVLLDGNSLPQDFFKTNFKTWDGGSIPFTFMKKGEKTDETVGSMSKEELTKKINSFN